MKADAVSFSWAGDKYLGRPYSEMDCQAFVERCMSDVGLHKDLAGSNAWYREVRNHGWVGSPEECMRKFGQIPKGALLFILKQDGGEPAKYKPDGLGNASHIGFKTGRNDGAIHSSSSRGCVATSKFSDKSINGGWNQVGLYDQFDYGTSVTWVLDHDGIGDKPPEPEKKEEVNQLQGVVTAQSGSTVNLRKTKDGALLERIPVGSTVTILETSDGWSRVEVNGLTGWMKSEFIRTEEEPVAPDPQQDEDFDFGDFDEVDPDESAELLAKIYVQLGEIRDLIEKTIGRG